MITLLSITGLVVAGAAVRAAFKGDVLGYLNLSLLGQVISSLISNSDN